MYHCFTSKPDADRTRPPFTGRNCSVFRPAMRCYPIPACIMCFKSTGGGAGATAPAGRNRGVRGRASRYRQCEDDRESATKSVRSRPHCRRLAPLSRLLGQLHRSADRQPGSPPPICAPSPLRFLLRLSARLRLRRKCVDCINQPDRRAPAARRNRPTADRRSRLQAVLSRPRSGREVVPMRGDHAARTASSGDFPRPARTRERWPGRIAGGRYGGGTSRQTLRSGVAGDHRSPARCAGPARSDTEGAWLAALSIVDRGHRRRNPLGAVRKTTSGRYAHRQKAHCRRAQRTGGAVTVRHLERTAAFKIRTRNP